MQSEQVEKKLPATNKFKNLICKSFRINGSFEEFWCSHLNNDKAKIPESFDLLVAAATKYSRMLISRTIHRGFFRAFLNENNL